MRFEFATSNRILFGPGIISEVPALAASFGQRLFSLLIQWSVVLLYAKVC